MNQCTATFAAGCFWGVENTFRNIEGVISTRVGYTGGHTENSSYEDVCRHDTGHAEAIEVTFDNDAVDYVTLLFIFFNCHNPTTKRGQGLDIGPQYRSAVFYHDAFQKELAKETIVGLNESEKYTAPIITEVSAAGVFYPAEAYHQCYLEKQGRVKPSLISGNKNASTPDG